MTSPIRRLIGICLLAGFFLAACIAPLPPAPVGIAGGSANPITEMFDHVPESATQDRAWISYIDYEAALASRGLTPLTDEQAHDRNRFGQWGAVVATLESDLHLPQYMIKSAEMRESVGFTVSEVRREVMYGQPPGWGVVLEGDFDPAAIQAALAKRGYIESEVGGVRVWCGALGCDHGLYGDLAYRDKADPLGGRNGRQQPLLATDHLLFSSGDYDVFTGQVKTYQGQQPALSDNAGYRAMAEAAHSLGSTIQMHVFTFAADFWQPLEIPDGTDPALAESWSGFGSLPEYSLWGIADIWDGKQQIAALLLVYESAEAAEAGGGELDHRLTTGIIPRRHVTMVQFMADRGAQLQPATVYESSTGKFVAIVTFTYPMPAMYAEGDPSLSDHMSGLVYQNLWGMMLIGRELGLFLVSEVQP